MGTTHKRSASAETGFGAGAGNGAGNGGASMGGPGGSASGGVPTTTASASMTSMGRHSRTSSYANYDSFEVAPVRAPGLKHSGMCVVHLHAHVRTRAHLRACERAHACTRASTRTCARARARAPTLTHIRPRARSAMSSRSAHAGRLRFAKGDRGWHVALSRNRWGLVFLAVQAVLLMLLAARYFGGEGAGGGGVPSGASSPSRGTEISAAARAARSQQHAEALQAQSERVAERRRARAEAAAAEEAGAQTRVEANAASAQVEEEAKRSSQAQEAGKAQRVEASPTVGPEIVDAKRTATKAAAAAATLSGAARHSDPGRAYAYPHMAEAPVFGETRKFLVYQPQFGMGNQLLALKSAVAMATVLDRWLVVPHYHSNNAHGKYVPFEDIFDWDKFQEMVPRSLPMDEFLALGVRPTRLFDMLLPLKTVHQHFDYFTDLRVFGDARQLNESISRVDANGVEHHIKLSDEDVRRKYGVMEDQVLAFSTTYKMFSHFSDGRLTRSVANSWSQSIIPAPRVRAAAEAAVAVLRGPSGDGKFSCAHVRRTDFNELCNVADSGWLASLSSRGYICWPTMEEIVDQLQVLGAERVFVASDAPQEVRAHAGFVGAFDAAYGDDFAHLLSGGVADAAMPLMEVEVCSHADTLVVNRYSTFSLFMAHSRHIRKPSTSSEFWMRTDVMKKVQAAQENIQRKKQEDNEAKADAQAEMRRRL